MSLLKLQAIQKATGDLGGTGHGKGMFGEMIRASNDLLADGLVYAFNVRLGEGNPMMKKLRIGDMGSGLGKPSYHFSTRFPYAEVTAGIEFDAARVGLAHANLRMILIMFKKYNQNRTPIARLKMAPTITIYESILNLDSFDQFDAIVSFDVAFEPPLMEFMGTRWNEAQRARVLISFYNEDKLRGFGFHVERVWESMPCSMSGSGEGHTAWVYVHPQTVPRNVLVGVVGRKRRAAAAGSADVALEAAIKLCMEGSREDVLKHLQEDMIDLLDGRGLRTKSPVARYSPP
jgi:hypothetical protein